MTPAPRAFALWRRPSETFRCGWLRAAVGGAIVAASVGLAACSATSSASHQARRVTPIAIDANQAARLISAYRAEKGLGAVRVDARLMRVATDYARVMGERDRIKHGIGQSLPRRVQAAGYDWGYVAENLAASYRSLDDAMRGWKKSPGHNKNLLGPYATDIGIAAVATSPGSDHSTYWALVLGMVQPQRLVARAADGRPIR